MSESSSQQIEKRQLINAYRNLLRACKPNIQQEDKKFIRQSFNFAMEAHKGMRRKSGELYIFHPLSVAMICAKEMGLGVTSIVSALLHDVVEDTDVTCEDIEATFGKKVATIIDGLTKISGVVGKSQSIQAENFRKILLTLADDVRVILIKIADRLHNMRTLDSVPRQNQLKIASETMILFGPLAHRLGLYSIKTELEDFALKYTEPKIYKEIASKLQSSSGQRKRFIRKFINPIQKRLDQNGLKYDIKSRPKSVYSIYQKMKQQNIPFEEVYDIFAIRIVLDTPPEREKEDCWRVYSIITDFYKPNPNRLRDWISTPKGNGYESLHTTVMGPNGKWVEVQIRSNRMHEIAEKGYAAHWKYKEGGYVDAGLEDWIRKVRELLENAESNAIDFFDDFRLNLFADEVFLFTPKGALITLPVNSTALDFAFEIHTEVGNQCLGAKVNHKLVPLNQRLKSGDQVEILTSRNQKPKNDWLNYVVTAKAKSKIKNALKEQKRITAQKGKKLLEHNFKALQINFSNTIIEALVNFYDYDATTNFYHAIGSGSIQEAELQDKLKHFKDQDKIATNGHQKQQARQHQLSKKDKPDVILVGDTADNDYTFAKCCNPIPGDDIFGFITLNSGIKIHRTNCPNGIQLMSKYGSRIVKARWTTSEIKEVKAFPVGIKIMGIDSIGIVSSITDIISKEHKVNMDSITLSSKAGAFEGRIVLYTYATEHLDSIIKQISALKGIDKVSRYEVEEKLSTESGDQEAILPAQND